MGCIHLQETIRLKEIVDGIDDAVAHPHDGPLPGGTQPEMTVLNEKIHAVFLLGDGIIGRI